MDPKDPNNGNNLTPEQKTAAESLTAQMSEIKKVNEALLASNQEMQARLQLQENDKAAELAKIEAEKLNSDADITALFADLDKSDRKKDPTDLDSMSNKELIAVIAEAMDTTVNANLTKLQRTLAEQQGVLNKKVAETQSAFSQFLVKQSINDLAVKYSDFEELKPDIAKQLEACPHISIESAYKLAKVERMEKSPAPQETFSEHPNEEVNVHGLPIVKRLPNEKFDNRGVTGFRNAFEAAHARLHP